MYAHVCAVEGCRGVLCISHTLQVNGPFLGLAAFAPVEPRWRSIKAVRIFGISISRVEDVLKQDSIANRYSNTATMNETRLTQSVDTKCLQQRSKLQSHSKWQRRRGVYVRYCSSAGQETLRQTPFSQAQLQYYTTLEIRTSVHATKLLRPFYSFF